MPVSQASDVSSSTSSLNIFSSGNVSVGSSVQLGDLAGAWGIGTLAYILIIGSFMLGLCSTIFEFLKRRAEGKTTDFNIIKHLTFTCSYFVFGLLLFVMMSVLLNKVYGISMEGRLKYFWEARYELIVDSIVANTKYIEIARGMLFILDLTSRFAYWSIVMIFVVAFAIMFTYVLSLFSDFRVDNASNITVARSMFNGVVGMFVESILFTMFAVFVSKLLFSGSPTIQGVGTVSTITDAVIKSVHYFVKIGLSGTI